MTLEQLISQDYIKAMKERNKEKATTLNFLRAQIKQVLVDERLDAVDNERVIAIVKKQIKQRQDSIDQYVSGGREELADKERFELNILQEYLPAQLSGVEIDAMIEKIMMERKFESIKDMGALMKAVLDKTGGAADGKLVSELVKKKLMQK